MELSKIIQQLPPEKLSQMQALMHNMQAGFDVRKEMEEFEKTLPPGFREKVASLLMSQPGAFGAMSSEAPVAGETKIHGLSAVPNEPAAPASIHAANEGPMDMRDARLTVLRAVAEGSMTPEEAERVLFAG